MGVGHSDLLGFQLWLTSAKKISRIADEILIQSAKLEKEKEYHMPKGTIARLMDRGFGFIKTEEGGDLFFHRNELEGVEFNNLSEGQEVEFEKGQGRDGRPAAVKVRITEAEVKEELPSAEESIEAPEAVEEGSIEAP